MPRRSFISRVWTSYPFTDVLPFVAQVLGFTDLPASLSLFGLVSECGFVLIVRIVPVTRSSPMLTANSR